MKQNQTNLHAVYTWSSMVSHLFLKSQSKNQPTNGARNDDIMMGTAISDFGGATGMCERAVEILIKSTESIKSK